MKRNNLYKWKAINNLGKIQEDFSLFTDLELAYNYILKNGLQPIYIKKINRFFCLKWSEKDRLTTLKQLSMLLQAGTSLPNSLLLIAEENNSIAWKALLQDLTYKISQGISFSQAISCFPDVFPDIYIQLFKLGEITGKLEQCCIQLIYYQEQTLSLKNALSKALRYPILVLCTIFFVITIIITMVLPEFKELYKISSIPLPYLTIMLIGFSDFILKNGIYFIFFIIIFYLFLSKFLIKNNFLKKTKYFLLFNIPLLSYITIYYTLSNLFQTIYLSQNSGLLLLNGLKLARNCINNLHYETALKNIEIKILQGESFYNSFLSENKKIGNKFIFPLICQKIIHVGEESGNLEEALNKLAIFYRKNTKLSIDKTISFIEPVLILVMSVIVSVLIIAIYLPIFELSNLSKNL